MRSNSLSFFEKKFKPIPFEDEDKNALVEYLQDTVFKQSPQFKDMITVILPDE